MKKSTILLLWAATLLFTACDQGEMSLPNDYTLPDASEYVLGKTLDEAIAYLQKKGYTCYDLPSDEAVDAFDKNGVEYLCTLERGGAVPVTIPISPYEIMESEEIFELWIRNDTVRSAGGVRNFKNMRDAINVYRKWSNHTWRHIVPDALDWSATIAIPHPDANQNERDKNIEWKDYYDGTCIENRDEVEGRDRKAFENALNGLTDVFEMNEKFERQSRPKQLEMQLLNRGGDGRGRIYYDNQNRIVRLEDSNN